MVDFLGCWLMQRLCRILLHFLFRFKIDGAIFYAMVGFIAMEHAVWRFHCVLASIVPQPRFEVLPPGCIGGSLIESL
jgi:hypothetical protein